MNTKKRLFCFIWAVFIVLVLIYTPYIDSINDTKVKTVLPTTFQVDVFKTIAELSEDKQSCCYSNEEWKIHFAGRELVHVRLCSI